MALLRILAPLPFQERNPERLAVTVRRVSAAYGIATLIFAAAFSTGMLGDERIQSAWVAAAAAAGFLPIAAAAKRWPVASAGAFVFWIWAASVASLFSSHGRFEVAIGIFLTAIVAAALMLGGAWSVAIAVASAAISAAVVGWFVRTGEYAVSDPPTPLSLWAVTMMSVAALPVLLGEALGRMRRALRDAEEAERRLVADHARDLIWLVEDDAVVYASPASVAMFGWTPEEMIARGSRFATFTPDSAQAVRATLEEAFQSGRDHVRYEAEHLRKDGTSIWCEVEASLRPGPTGACARCLASRATSASAAGARRSARASRASSCRRRRWRSSGASRRAWRTTSTTNSP